MRSCAKKAPSCGAVGKTNIDPLLGPRNIPFAESLGFKGPRVIFSKGILKKWFLMHFRFFIANLRYLAKKGMPHLLYECVAPSILRMCCMLDLAIHLSYFIISYYVNWRVPIQNTSHFHPSEPSKLTP